MKVGVVQFVKGKWETGERHVLERFPDQVRSARMGEGFTWDTQDRARDIRAAQAGLGQAAKEMIEACRSEDPPTTWCSFDELNIVLRYDYLPLDEVVAGAGRAQAGGPARRGHRPQRQARADRGRRPGDRDDLVKHPFREQNVKAQKGIEF